MEREGRGGGGGGGGEGWRGRGGGRDREGGRKIQTMMLETGVSLQCRESLSMGTT